MVYVYSDILVEVFFVAVVNVAIFHFGCVFVLLLRYGAGGKNWFKL